MRIIKSNMLIVSLLIIGFLMQINSSAEALTMTFNSGTGTPLSYTENNMTVATLSVDPLAHIHLDMDDGLDADMELTNHGTVCCSSPYSFTYSEGLITEFDLISFVITKVDNFAVSVFTSDLGDTLTITTPGSYTFNWTGITSVVWDVTGGSFSDMYMDDFTFYAGAVPVPEPSTLVLFFGGLVSFVGLKCCKAKIKA